MKNFLLAFIISGTSVLHAQDRYVVQIKNKSNTPFSFSNPSAYLSPKAIQRRVNQGIAIDSADLPVNPSYLNQISATGADIIGKSKWLNTITIQTTSSAVLNAVNALPFVDGTINVGRIKNPGTALPDKFSYEKLFTEKKFLAGTASQKSASFNYGQAFNQVNMIGGVTMHNNGYTGSGIVIAVIDAGFYNADNMVVFDSLRAQNLILGTWDFNSDDINVYDDDSHGSYVLSTMGGNWPGNMVGTAPHAGYWLLRSEFAPSEFIIEEYDWAEAAEFADSVGADVINSSLGYTEFDDPAQNHTYADMNGDVAPSTRAADFAGMRGIVVCNSAGNSGSNNWNFIGAPADADSILTVGAVDEFGSYAFFSSNGPTSDGRVKPNVAAQGQNTIVADVFNGGVYPGNGTSFSSPVMAGMVACLLQCHPSATSMQIIEALQQSATQALNPDTLVGYGIPNVAQACVLLSGLQSHDIRNGDNLLITGPNPFDHTLEFSFYSDSNQMVDFIITDLLGKIIYTTKDSFKPVSAKKYSIPFSYSNGLYVVSAKSDNGVYSKKVVKY